MSRILIAEDEDRIAAFVEKGLRANGFVTTVVVDGDLALTAAMGGEHDLMILDLGLPGGRQSADARHYSDGPRVRARYRRWPRRRRR